MLSSIGFYGLTLCLYQFFQLGHGKMEAFVLEGENAKIENFPHSAHLSMSCRANTRVSYWYCGSSIVNQMFILTAAHCVDECTDSSYIFASFGNKNKNYGSRISVVKAKKHSDYSTYGTLADIAVAQLKHPLKFQKSIKRVALMRNPPYNEEASLAGWGLVNEEKKVGTAWLQQIKQNVMKRSECEEYLGEIPDGVFCAGRFRSNKYAAVGDSGSALIVRGYIQIGIVSYKLPQLSKSLVVYTDIGYFYDWIRENIWNLNCFKDQ